MSYATHIPIGQCALGALLSMAAAGVWANDCAILATGAASELAIDDPDRFEYLTRVCRGESPTKKDVTIPSRPSPATVPLLQNRPAGKPPQPTAAPGNHAVSDDKQRNLNEGCAYLFYSVPDSRHAVGTEACKDGRNLVCKRVGAASFQWVEGGSACVNDPDLLSIRELNLKNLKGTLKQLNIFD